MVIFFAFRLKRGGYDPSFFDKICYLRKILCNRFNGLDYFDQILE
jgi:hypothetical protein